MLIITLTKDVLRDLRGLCQPNRKTLWHSCLRTFVLADCSVWNMLRYLDALRFLDTLGSTFLSPLGLYLNAKFSGKFSFTTLFNAEHHPLFLLHFIFIFLINFSSFCLIPFILLILFIIYLSQLKESSRGVRILVWFAAGLSSVLEIMCAPY